MSYLLFSDSVDQVVTNTASETTLYTFTIPANLLTSRCLLIEQTAKYAVNNVAGRQYTIRLKLNSTTMFTSTPPSPGKTTQVCANAERWTLAGMSTSSVRGVMSQANGGPGSDTGNFGTVSGPGVFGSNVLSVDISAAVTLDMTVQMSSNGVGHTFTSMGIWGILQSQAPSLTDPFNPIPYISTAPRQ